jgi:hypothetical protein
MINQTTMAIKLNSGKIFCITKGEVFNSMLAFNKNCPVLTQHNQCFPAPQAHLGPCVLDVDLWIWASDKAHNDNGQMDHITEEVFNSGFTCNQNLMPLHVTNASPKPICWAGVF